MALVVGSECAALGHLGFVGEIARGVHARLTEPHDGGWTNASEAGPLINPESDRLGDAIVRSIEVADELEATLLIWFVGHGIQTGDLDMYLMGVNSPSTPTSRSAVLLSQVLREELNTHPRVDGLILVIDACDGGELVRGAGARLVDRSVLMSQRLELLTASADGPAFDGCLSTTFLSLESSDRHQRHLALDDLKRSARTRCLRQDPVHLTVDARRTGLEYRDDALWLVRNRSYKPDALAGFTLEGLVGSGDLIITDSLRGVLQDVVDADSEQARWITGPPGSGKTTALTLLYRSSQVEDLVPQNYLDCLIRLPALSVLDSSLSREIAVQLDRVHGLDLSLSADFDLADLAATIPTSRRRLRFGLDGFDEISENLQREVLRIIRQAGKSPEASRIRFIVTSSIPPPNGLKARTIQTDQSALNLTARKAIEAWVEAQNDPFKAESGRLSVGSAQLLGEAIAKDAGPLNVQLRSEFVSRTLGASPDPVKRARWSPTILCLSTSTGAVPLPLDLGQKALEMIGLPTTRSDLHNGLSELSDLALRFTPGEQTEAVALVHSGFLASLIEWLGDSADTSLRTFNGAIADLLLQPSVNLPDYWQRYARFELERHLIAAGRFREARSWSWATVDRTAGRSRRGFS